MHTTRATFEGVVEVVKLRVIWWNQSYLVIVHSSGWNMTLGEMQNSMLLRELLVRLHSIMLTRDADFPAFFGYREVGTGNKISRESRESREIWKWSKNTIFQTKMSTFKYKTPSICSSGFKECFTLHLQKDLAIFGLLKKFNFLRRDANWPASVQVVEF